MQAEKLMQVKDAVLKLRQQLRAGQIYQSLPSRMATLIKQLPSTVTTTVIRCYLHTSMSRKMMPFISGHLRYYYCQCSCMRTMRVSSL